MHLQKIVLVLIGGFLALAPRAHADTRDDVVSGIGRCAVMHDNRVWLDCVYGAVQPMRAQLGLQPVPEFQQRLVPPPQLGMAPPPPPAAAAAAPARAPVPAPNAARVASKSRPKVGFWKNLLGDAPPVTVSRMSSYSFDKMAASWSPWITVNNGGKPKSKAARRAGPERLRLMRSRSARAPSAPIICVPVRVRRPTRCSRQISSL